MVAQLEPSLSWVLEVRSLTWNGSNIAMPNKKEKRRTV
jgi:hypothetical protein